MKKTTFVAGILFMLVLLFAGTSCTDSQAGIILTDTTGDHQVDSRGIDRNHDGNIDIDANGELIIWPGLGPYKYTEVTDDLMPVGLIGAGALTGLSVLGAIGAWWRSAKPGRMLANLITSIQLARADIKKNGEEGALSAFDRMLKNTQDPELRAWIIKAKKALDLASVTDSTSSPDAPA